MALMERHWEWPWSESRAESITRTDSVYFVACPRRPRWNEEKKDFAICARLSSEERILANMPARWKEKLYLRSPDGTWPVEQILGKRKHRRRIEYHVRWKVRLRCACRQ